MTLSTIPMRLSDKIFWSKFKVITIVVPGAEAWLQYEYIFSFFTFRCGLITSSCIWQYSASVLYLSRISGYIRYIFVRRRMFSTAQIFLMFDYSCSDFPAMPTFCMQIYLYCIRMFIHTHISIIYKYKYMSITF